MKIELTINARQHSVDIPDDEILLDVLRQLGYSSVREGCGVGACGSCTVLVNKKSVSSCLMLASRFDGAEIITCEGLAEDDPVIGAFIESGALQCGYCIPGFVLMTTELLSENQHPDRADILHHLEGNLCRCGTYPQIIDAIFSAVENAKA